MAFSLRSKYFWERFAKSFPACTFVYVVISSRVLISFFRPGSVHSGSARRDDRGWVSPIELHVSSFSWGFPHRAWTSSLQLRWVKSACVIRCNLPPAVLAEWLGSFTSHSENTGSERTSNKSQHRKFTLGKKILPLPPPRIEPATFRLWVRRCANWVTPDARSLLDVINFAFF